MPRIIPVNMLKNTGEMSAMCHAADEPIFITKNGFGDMVMMSMEFYDKNRFMQKIYDKLAKSDKDIKEGAVSDARLSLEDLRGKYEL